MILYKHPHLGVWREQVQSKLARDRGRDPEVRRGLRIRARRKRHWHPGRDCAHHADWLSAAASVLSGALRH